MIPVLPYLDPQAFQHSFSPLSSLGGEWQSEFGRHLASSQSQPTTVQKGRLARCFFKSRSNSHLIFWLFVVIFPEISQYCVCIPKPSATFSKTRLTFPSLNSPDSPTGFIYLENKHTHKTTQKIYPENPQNKTCKQNHKNKTRNNHVFLGIILHTASVQMNLDQRKSRIENKGPKRELKEKLTCTKLLPLGKWTKMWTCLTPLLNSSSTHW